MITNSQVPCFWTFTWPVMYAVTGGGWHVIKMGLARFESQIRGKNDVLYWLEVMVTILKSYLKFHSIKKYYFLKNDFNYWHLMRFDIKFMEVSSSKCSCAWYHHQRYTSGRQKLSGVYNDCKITYLATYLIIKPSHVANGNIPFQVKDWSRMFAQLLLHLFLWKTNKTQPDLLLGLLASYF